MEKIIETHQHLIGVGRHPTGTVGTRRVLWAPDRYCGHPTGTVRRSTLVPMVRDVAARLGIRDATLVLSVRDVAARVLFQPKRGQKGQNKLTSAPKKSTTRRASVTGTSSGN
jgi:hypothetical protein